MTDESRLSSAAFTRTLNVGYSGGR